MFGVNKFYNFETTAPALLGGGYNHVKVLAVLDFNDAVAQAADLATLNSSVFVANHATEVPDPRVMTYIKVEKSPDTHPVILSTSWILKSSIVESHNKGVASITIPDVTSEQVEEIRQMLVLLKINNAVIKTTY